MPIRCSRTASTEDPPVRTDRSPHREVRGFRAISDPGISPARVGRQDSGDGRLRESPSGAVIHRNLRCIPRSVHRSIHNILGRTSCLATTSGVKWAFSVTERDERLHAQRPMPIVLVRRTGSGKTLPGPTGGFLQTGTRCRPIRAVRSSGRVVPVVGDTDSAGGDTTGAVRRTRATMVIETICTDWNSSEGIRR